MPQICTLRPKIGAHALTLTGLATLTGHWAVHKAFSRYARATARTSGGQPAQDDPIESVVRSIGEAADNDLDQKYEVPFAPGQILCYTGYTHQHSTSTSCHLPRKPSTTDAIQTDALKPSADGPSRMVLRKPMVVIPKPFATTITPPITRSSPQLLLAPP